MSGHSKWATIRRKKGAADAKRGKIFNKIIREITVAAKQGGGDPETNARLRIAIQNAKANNMPAKNIENAIAKGTGQVEGGGGLEDVIYEGYGPGGAALMIEVLTDNKNRTVSEIRHLLTKHSGNLGENGSVSWMFHTQGLVVVDKMKIEEEKLMEIILDAGAEDMETTPDAYEIKVSQDNFESVRTSLDAKGIPAISAEITKMPKNTVKIEGEEASKILKLMEALEEQDDVQHVYANFDIDEKEMEKLAK